MIKPERLARMALKGWKAPCGCIVAPANATVGAVIEAADAHVHQK